MLLSRSRALQLFFQNLSCETASLTTTSITRLVIVLERPLWVKGQGMTRCKSRKGQIVLAASSLLITLSLAEISLRYLGLGHPITYEISTLWGYSPSPNQTERRFRDSLVTIDKNGFRIARPLEGGTPIIFFGDSITYGGSYVDDNQLFSSLTCEMLDSENVSPKYSCANAGVNGFGIRNMLGRIIYVEKQFPNAVIVLTIISDDFYRNFSQLGGLPFFIEKPPEPFPATIELIAYSIDCVRSYLRFKGSKISLHDEMQSQRDRLLAHIEIDMVAHSLRELLEKRNEKGKHTIVIWSPSRNWFNGMESEEEQYPHDKLQGLGVDAIDMAVRLRQTKKSASEIFYDDAHLERNGHRAYAEVISAELSRLNIPSNVSSKVISDQRPPGI